MKLLLSAASQAARAALTGLIPLTLIALFGWASAGSGSGNTGDALRGAGLLWLGSHHVGIELAFATTSTTGLVSVLPIGLLLVPLLTLRGAGLRLAREVEGARLDHLLGAALALAFSYSILVTAVAFLADSPSVRPRYLEACVYGFLIALFAAGSRLLRITLPEPWRSIWRYLKLIFGVLLLLGVALVVASLILNFAEVLNIFAVLRLGVLSTFFVIIICIAYLPNAAIWALAYASGIGFGFGVQTLISPWSSVVGAVPAFPLLAAIPAQPPRWATVLPLVVLVVMVFAALRVRIHGNRDAVALHLAVLLVAVVLTWFSGGSLIGGGLSAVGPSLWKFPLIVTAHAMAGYLVALAIQRFTRPRRPSIN